jgi:hypothetical protein
MSAGFSQEQLTDTLKKVYNIAKANLQMLNEAGLFKLDHVKVFSAELVKPLSKELFNVGAMQQIVLAKAPDMLVRGAPTAATCRAPRRPCAPTPSSRAPPRSPASSS